MNIFKYDGEEFQRVLDDFFNKLNSQDLLNELVSCGLEVNEEMNYYYMEMEYVNNIEYKMYVHNNSTGLFKTLIKKLTNNNEKNDIKEAA